MVNLSFLFTLGVSFIKNEKTHQEDQYHLLDVFLHSMRTGVFILHHVFYTFLLRIYFWNGFCRTAVGSAIQLATFDRCKQGLVRSGWMQDNIAADFSASFCSGFLVCVGMNPFDVISTRMYNQPIDHATHRGKLYSGVTDCLAKTIKTEGLAGLYKGFFGMKSFSCCTELILHSSLSQNRPSYCALLCVSGIELGWCHVSSYVYLGTFETCR